MASKKKIATVITAISTSAALLLGGACARQSISQTALNEASDVINPSATLTGDEIYDTNINGTTINLNEDFVLCIQAVDDSVNVNNATVTGVNGGILAEYGTGGIVSLENVTVTAESNSPTWWVNTAVAATNGAIVHIYGGSYTGDNAVFVTEGDGSGIVIYDGYFDGKLNGSNISIVGGTFTDDPTAYVHLVYDEVIENGDGTYTVQEMNFAGAVILDSDGSTATVYSGDRCKLWVNDEDGYSVSPYYFTFVVTDSEGNELTAEKDYVWDEISESVIIYNNTAENIEVYLRATNDDIGLEAWGTVTVKPAVSDDATGGDVSGQPSEDSDYPVKVAEIG